jgi:hypothetical protein
MKMILKALTIGAITTICRVALQLLMVDTGQTVLQPSVFAVSGTLPIAFSVLALFTYSLLAAAFLLFDRGITGAGVSRGLKYGTALCLGWVVYLFEPLPHGVSIWLDNVAYALADGAALLIMGLLIGLLLADKGTFRENANGAVHASRGMVLSPTAVQILIPMIVFVAGRLLQYLVLDIYSSFNSRPTATILWCVMAGIVSAGATLWLRARVEIYGKYKHPLAIACALFAINLVLFNSFMPLVFDFSVLDLCLRTGIDIIAIVFGLLLATSFIKRRNGQA